MCVCGVYLDLAKLWTLRFLMGRVFFVCCCWKKQVQTLIEDVQKLQSTLNQLRESSARQLSNFEEELQVRGRHIQRLEAQLEAQKDYQEIRRELR